MLQLLDDILWNRRGQAFKFNLVNIVSFSELVVIRLQTFEITDYDLQIKALKDGTLTNIS